MYRVVFACYACARELSIQRFPHLHLLRCTSYIKRNVLRDMIDSELYRRRHSERRDAAPGLPRPCTIFCLRQRFSSPSYERMLWMLLWLRCLNLLSLRFSRLHELGTGPSRNASKRYPNFFKCELYTNHAQEEVNISSTIFDTSSSESNRENAASLQNSSSNS